MYRWGGIVENMSYFTPAECPDNKYYIFGKDGGKYLADDLKLAFLGEVTLGTKPSRTPGRCRATGKALQEGYTRKKKGPCGRRLLKMCGEKKLRQRKFNEKEKN